MTSPAPTQLTLGVREVKTSKRKRGWRRREPAWGRVSWQASWKRWQEGQMESKVTEVGAYN